MSYQPAPPDKDPRLWHIAVKRASFKKHLLVYLAVNIFLWILWFYSDNRGEGRIPWPAWSSFGWGIGLFSHYISAYSTGATSSVEKEYEKLQNTNR